MFCLLDGLPLAIAQAGAYLQESGVGVGTYLQFYEQQWKDLMESQDRADALLQDYLDRSVWTTWTISYKAIRKKDKSTANLLLLWASLDNKDLWYGLLAVAYKKSSLVAIKLSEWIGEIASNELEFIKAIKLLRNYSLIEDVDKLASYATHPVVHRWAYHFQSEDMRMELGQLAVVIVGMAVPDGLTRDCSTMRRRLLPHAQACSRWVSMDGLERTRSYNTNSLDSDETKEKNVILGAINALGFLYEDQGKLAEAEKMFQRALRDAEALGPNYTFTLQIVDNLGIVYKNQGKLADAEKMYQRALRGAEALGPNHILTLKTVNNLGNLHKNQGKLAEAEKMYERALQGYEEALDPNHILTLKVVNNLGCIYTDQGKLPEAEKMYERALQGKEEALGPNHTSTLNTVNNLGVLYVNQGKLTEAEKMYERVLRGYEEAIGLKNVETYRPALGTMRNKGDLYVEQGDLTRAREAYSRALLGFQTILGSSNDICQRIKAKLEALDQLPIESWCYTNPPTR